MKTKQHKHWILGAVFRSNKVNKRKRTFKIRKKKMNDSDLPIPNIHQAN